MKKFLIAGVVAASVLALTGCNNTSSPSAMLGFVVGNGQDGHNSTLHRVIYPNQNSHVSGSELTRYVPSNARNYIVNDGTKKNANGDRIGDRFQPSKAYTKTGTPVLVSYRMFWTLNQDHAALNDFYPFCFKYTCWSDDPNSGNANFSTPGWNGMLGENFSPTADKLAVIATHPMPDLVWETHDPTLYDKMGAIMSANFQDQMRAVTGYNQDLFCGSGNSGWSDPNHPGSGTFTCSNVRVVVDDVEPVNAQLQVDQSNTAAKKALNIARLNAAKAIYGKDAGAWLAMQDTIDHCKQPAVCVINIGGGTGTAPSVSVNAGR